MSSARTTRRHVSAAVTTVLAVTLGAGALGVPASAAPAPAPAPVTASAAAATAIAVPDGIQVVSAGTTGFLGRRITGDYNPTYYWTSYAEGTTTTLPAGYGYSGGLSDYVVSYKSDSSSYQVRDMSAPGSLAVGLSYGDQRYSLAGVAGQSLVMHRVDDANAMDVFLMSRPEPGSHNPTTRDVALPPTARNLRVRATALNEALIQYQQATPNGTQYSLAVVDLGTGNIRETVSTGTTAPNTGIYLTATDIAWVDNPTGNSARLTVVKRNSDGERSTVLLGSTPAAADLDLGILGGWAMTTWKGGGTATFPSSSFPLTARRLADPATTVTLLDHVDSMATAPDGALIARGGSVTNGGEGIYRIAPAENGAPVATLVASTGRKTQLEYVTSAVPGTVDLDQNGGRATLTWTLNRGTAQGTVTLRHVATGKLAQYSFNGFDGSFSGTGVLTWNWQGLVAKTVGGIGGFAPGGDYTWELKAKPLNGIGPDVLKTGTFKVARKAGLHDYTNNGSTDVLSRDSSGRLFRDDTVMAWSSTEVYSSERVQIGTGWQVYNQLEAVGNIAGAPAADLVARDASGVLWEYLGKGDGTFAPRTKIGSGWNAYNKITGGSDLNGDGRSDLLATDTSGVLWFYKGTGDYRAPFATRVRVGGGWGVYNQITAVGNIAGSASGDLVARDTYGVLWLYQGTGAGTFSPRVRIGSGWGSYTSLVGVGDFDRDGLGDLYAVGASGSRLYSGTGSVTGPFKPATFTSVHSDASRFNAIF
ncbi:VCBS repeat-containing protein [Streptomyces sp. NPDC006197]|uniref:FG-GAP repeat domain-containing protein n=1 Tax=Streptomyces sp. NPDC006197 TaxID=3156685 RepID=UPI0033BC3B48